MSHTPQTPNVSVSLVLVLFLLPVDPSPCPRSLNPGRSPCPALLCCSTYLGTCLSWRPHSRITEVSFSRLFFAALFRGAGECTNCTIVCVGEVVYGRRCSLPTQRCQHSRKHTPRILYITNLDHKPPYHQELLPSPSRPLPFPRTPLHLGSPAEIQPAACVTFSNAQNSLTF